MEDNGGGSGVDVIELVYYDKLISHGNFDTAIGGVAKALSSLKVET